MNCDDFLRRRSGVAHKNLEFWPQDLQLHVSTCEDCARLEDYLSDTDAKNIDLEAIETRVQNLVAADLTRVTPIASARRRTLTLMSTIAATIAGIMYLLGRSGWAEMSSGQAYLTFGSIATLLLIAASELSAQMVPGEKRRVPPLPFFAICLLFMPLIALLLFPTPHDPKFVVHALRCWEIGTACALLVVPSLRLLLRRSFPLSPDLHFGSAGLLAGLMGIAVLELHCPIMDGSHKAIGHGAVALTAAIGGVTVFLLWSKIVRQPNSH